jgi:hypothetical protein
VIGSRHVMRKGQLTTKPGNVTLVVHDPIPTVAAAEPDVRQVRALAARVREVVRPAVDAEAAADAADKESRR